jgi:uncharacterized protein YecE (DUF72 family)
MPATIRVGTASWTDHEPFYPPEYDKAAMKSQRITYYARYFSLAEVDSTFYNLQPARNFQLWAERTPDDFAFDVKAYGELTWHHRDDDGKPITPSADTFAKFAEMVRPMREAGKLRALLFQFPPWFTFAPERVEYLGTVRELLPEDTVAVEFRHRSWVEGTNADETRAALEAHRLAYCAVDEPQIGSGSVPPVVLLTDPRFAMVRFHGRNAAMWYGKGLSSSRDRFNYLYSQAELAPWAERVQRIAERLGDGAEVHVVANNNARNYGIVNALDLQELLGQPRGQGHELPAGVLATIAERAASEAQAGSGDGR